MMRLFSRRRTTPESTPASWMPLHEMPACLSGDDAGMDDDGQVLPFAHRVTFLLPGHPDGPVITCWTYVAYGKEEGTYCLGLRYVYAAGRYPVWSYTGWTSQPLGEVYTDAGLANGGASLWASRLLMASRVDMLAELPEVFGWDGGVF